MTDIHYTHRPIRTKPVPDNIEDLTGHKRGALTVVGYYGDHRDGHHRWVVRCDCGCFTVRRARTLKRANMDDYCWGCNMDRAASRREFHAQHGRYPDYFELPT